MRLVSVTVLGSALVAAGMLAPGTGEANATHHDEVRVRPEVARPGERVEVTAPRCADTGREVTSEAFDGPVANGTATVRENTEPGAYTVTARCGRVSVKGQFRVAGRLVWPTLLTTAR
ncbi:hypothetical protein [Actinomadura chibensis]|uniref:Uncharacterized protein n=1 Tax=Actinomadura chibensis TaxID=392828 RepID=A0A5D0NVJ8_9ACTN|nr:hypothetical protein [Actinomadura chibensis]TYB48710.1 hypothetical protein FXF69_05930 [Actinomadura chibensis]